jgi:hypothetical protein
VKVSLAVTHKEGFLFGIQAFPDNPYDGHTLDGQLGQVEPPTGKVPETTFVDRGYKGHGVPEERSRVLISGTRRLSYTHKRHLRRRAAVEPEIGHIKNDGLLGRNFLNPNSTNTMGDPVLALAAPRRCLNGVGKGVIATRLGEPPSLNFVHGCAVVPPSLTSRPFVSRDKNTHPSTSSPASMNPRIRQFRPSHSPPSPKLQPSPPGSSLTPWP